MVKIDKDKPFTTIARLSVPTVISELSDILATIVDGVMISRYVGTLGIAAIMGSAITPIMIMIRVWNAIGDGCQVIMSHKFGAGDKEGFKKVCFNGVIINIIISFMMWIILLLFTKQFVMFLTGNVDVVEIASTYILAWTLRIPISAIGWNYHRALHAMGDTKINSIHAIVFSLSNVVFDIVFMKYCNLGIAGAAYAVVVACIISLAIILWQAHKRDIIIVKVSLIDINEIKHILKVSVPLVIDYCTFRVAEILVGRRCYYYGVDVAAASSLHDTIEQAWTLIIYSIGSAMLIYKSTLIGMGEFKLYKKQDGEILKRLSIFYIGSLFLLGLIAPFHVALMRVEQEVGVLAIKLFRYSIPYMFLWGIADFYQTTLYSFEKSNIVAKINFAVVVIGRSIFVGLIWLIDANIYVLYLVYPLSWLLMLLFTRHYSNKVVNSVILESEERKCLNGR